MKKKLFGFVFTFALILSSAIGFTACGPNYKGVNLFGKNYKFNEVATYSMTDLQGNPISDWKQWINSNFGQTGFYAGDDEEAQSKNSASELIAYLESEDFINNLAGNSSRPVTLLKGAIVSIGGNGSLNKGATQKSGSFTVYYGENGRFTSTITAYDHSTYDFPLYDSGTVAGYTPCAPASLCFELTDYSREDGTIRDAVVSLMTTVGPITYVYASSYAYEITGKDNAHVRFIITYHLKTAN